MHAACHMQKHTHTRSHVITHMQIALVACYINLIASSQDILAYKGYGPIVRDAFGVGQPVVRMVRESAHTHVFAPFLRLILFAFVFSLVWDSRSCAW